MKNINLKTLAVFAFTFMSVASNAQWNPTGDNTTTGNLTIGSDVAGTYSIFIVTVLIKNT